MEKAWFDWDTFKKHIKQGHFDDMEQLENQSDNEDEKFWDDLGDALEFEDPEDLEDHQREGSVPRGGLMSANLEDSESKLILVDPETGEFDDDMDDSWQESKDQVMIQDWSGDENDPEY